MKKIIAPSAVVVVMLISILGCAIGGGSRTTTESISADEGGSITSTDGALTLEIPPGALVEDTDISIREVDPDDLPDEFAVVGEGMAYELEPDGLTFTEPVAVSLSLDPSSLETANGEGYDAYVLFSWSETNGLETLDELVLEISPSEGEATLQGELDHFSLLQRSKAGVTVALDEVDREQPVGAQFTARLYVQNTAAAEDPVVTDIHGSFHAYGNVELVGSGEFSDSSTRDSIAPAYQENGNFACKATPGTGSYGVQVHAVSTWGAEGLRTSKSVSIVLDSVVECVAPPPETPAPVSEGKDVVENMLLSMGYTPEQVTQLRIARVLDPKGDWIYSILGVTPGEARAWIDLMWTLGILSETDSPALQFWFNQSLFECGAMVDGQLTVCSITAGDFPEGNMFIFAAVLDGEIPLDDPDTYYSYSVVMDGDGDTSNNFEYMLPYNWDYFQRTDQWYQLNWDPMQGQWLVTLTIVRGGMPAAQHTDARAVIAGDAVVFFIPSSEVLAERPAYRITSFGHDGTFEPTASGGDVIGDDPTQTLLEITGDLLLLP
jgi:hypothetical protein